MNIKESGADKTLKVDLSTGRPSASIDRYKAKLKYNIKEMTADDMFANQNKTTAVSIR